MEVAFNKQLPAIKAAAQEHVAKIGKRAGELDDAAWKAVFGTVHRQLPTAARLAGCC